VQARSQTDDQPETFYSFFRSSWFIVYGKVNMKFGDRDCRGNEVKPRAEVYRLPNGQIVYMERDINVEGWARITRLSNCVNADASADGRWSRWTYTSADDADSALAAWDPEEAAAPMGWFLCGQANKNSPI
jgi:hypothetical protein